MKPDCTKAVGFFVSKCKSEQNDMKSTFSGRKSAYRRSALNKTFVAAEPRCQQSCEAYGFAGIYPRIPNDCDNSLQDQRGVF
jgi:hypothetical protein